DVQRNRIDEVHAIAALGQRQRIHTCAATHVEETARRRREMPLHDLERTDPFEPAERRVEALLFLSERIELENLGRDVIGAGWWRFLHRCPTRDRAARRAVDLYSARHADPYRCRPSRSIRP